MNLTILKWLTGIIMAEKLNQLVNKSFELNQNQENCEGCNSYRKNRCIRVVIRFHQGFSDQL